MTGVYYCFIISTAKTSDGHHTRDANGQNTPRDKLIKIGAKVVRHAKYVTFQLAEVAVPRDLSRVILDRIGRFRSALVMLESG